MRTNVKAPEKPAPRTHEGAVAYRTNAEQQLRRSVMANMLFENEFYEDGVSIHARIAETIPEVEPSLVARIAIEAREKMKLRHVPLAIVREMARHASHRPFVADALEQVIQRPDELSEFLSLYWQGESDPKSPLANQVKIGLARAFTKFNAYSLAKYNQDRAIKLRDVMFLVHPKPANAEQAEVFKQLAANTLPTPDTWEVELSAGKGESKRESWDRLLSENKLGALALLRNLRNMQQAGVELPAIRAALATCKTDRVLPFRFITAARYAPQLEPELEQAMFRCIADLPKLPGRTVLLVDVSGSMDCALSSKGETTRTDAACGLAVLARELCDEALVYTFSNNCVAIPARRGFALRDAALHSQPHGGTYLGGAVNAVNAHVPTYDRMIVITDEQSHDRVEYPKDRHGYIVNVASNQNGVGYGQWMHVDGWSEAVLDYIRVSEEG